MNEKKQVEIKAKSIKNNSILVCYNNLEKWFNLSDEIKHLLPNVNKGEAEILLNDKSQISFLSQKIISSNGTIAETQSHNINIEDKYLFGQIFNKVIDVLIAKDKPIRDNFDVYFDELWKLGINKRKDKLGY